MDEGSGRVVVVGSINEDLLTVVDRLPGRGETVGGGQFVHGYGGKGANQAVASARLGAKTWLIAGVGRDEAGRQALASLEAAGVDVSQVMVTAADTGRAQVIVDSHGANIIAVSPGANGLLTGAAVERALALLLTPGSIVLTNLEVSDEVVEATARAAARANCLLVLNSAPARRLSPAILSVCAVLVANQYEIELLGRSARELLAAGTGAVIVTKGEAGADLYRRHHPIFRQPPFCVTPVDTTGAGDAFCGALSCALASGHGLTEGLRLASAAGAFATLRIGAQGSLPERSELDAFIAATRVGPHKEGKHREQQRPSGTALRHSAR